ncbi:MAG TPA: hypothetical protein PLR28_06230 [Dokdonella sp.]|uniref:hypothetical protein n=1 Tax=Dokdonella sp. TaxID=2291710 RepID=UPI002CC15811|nr:hypothetical protein [Dokdonella sp.]HOX72646.1 hypothetical protein [Dokdonella sp.]HPG94136.1 hypothetical protein [Dokdonella sp.]HPN78511.1 hypothetical protein [Dokdonella sp.]
MNPDTVSTRRRLIRDFALFQLKLLLDALRDIVLSPISLAAVILDLMLSGQQAPRYFRAVLRLGERSEEWIDLWSAARGAKSADRTNVDALLARVEEVVSDPKVGARRARVLRRWAERQLSRARKRADPAAIARVPADDGDPPRT